MAWTPLLLSLLTLCQGAWAQSVLTQPASRSGSLGQSVSIPCTRSSGSISDRYVHWFQQHQGRSPKLIIYKDNKRPSGISERFSGSIDDSSNSATLSISGLQPEDEADYYCQSYGSNYRPTMVQINGEVRQKPRASLVSYSVTTWV